MVILKSQQYVSKKAGSNSGFIETSATVDF